MLLEWISQIIDSTNKASIRKRKLPTELVVWLVVGMGLYRDRSITGIVTKLDLVLSSQEGETLAASSIARARQRLSPAGGTTFRKQMESASLEDKIVQYALVKSLNAAYENDFIGFSYGFRPGRSQRDALDALITGLVRTNVNRGLDADISQFFDKVSHKIADQVHRAKNRRSEGNQAHT